MEFHRGVFTDELYDVYSKYEKAVHKKDHVPEDIKGHLCGSPAFDPENPEDQEAANRSAPTKDEEIDKWKKYKDEPIYPGKGSWHLYHRIDGKLVAVGIVDLVNNCLNSQYFIYDPEYSFLCLGVVGAIHEVEYIKMV